MLLQKNYTTVGKAKKLYFKYFDFEISEKTIYNLLKDYKNLFEFSVIKNKFNAPVKVFKSKDPNFFLTLNKLNK